MERTKTCRNGHVYIVGNGCKTCNRASMRKWDAAHPGYQKKYHAEHRERAAETHNAWKLRNPGRHELTTREWEKAHPERVSFYQNNRRARKMENYTEPFTIDQWKEVIEDYNGLCAYCGIAVWASEDHVIPLIAGGAHAIWNIVPACRSCNSKKRTRLWQPIKYHRYMKEQP